MKIETQKFSQFLFLYIIYIYIPPSPLYVETQSIIQRAHQKVVPQKNEGLRLIRENGA